MANIIVSNAARCKKCGDEIFSSHTHDFKMCKCGAIAVDGGTDYLRRVGNLDAKEELSIVLLEEVVNDCIAEAAKGRERGVNGGVNDRGMAYHILRALRRHGYFTE